LPVKIIESHRGNIWYEEPTERSNTGIDDDAHKGDSIKTGTVIQVYSYPP